MKRAKKLIEKPKMPMAAEMDEMLRMDKKIQEFENRVKKGDKEVLAQIKDVMDTNRSI